MPSAPATDTLRPEPVLRVLREHCQDWEQRYNVARIGLFGSVARDQANPSSDVDIWVELDPLTPFAMVHLKAELKTLLQRPVDLVRLRGRMNPSLRAAILKEGISV